MEKSWRSTSCLCISCLFWSSKRYKDLREKRYKLKYRGLAEDLVLLGRVEGPMGPPCSLCPRQMLRLMQQCEFGDLDCYEYLVTTPKEEGDYKQNAEAMENTQEDIDLESLGEITINGKVVDIDEVT